MSSIRANRERAAQARVEAKEAGERFYQGDPCQRDHTGLRYTSTGQCVPCISVRSKNKSLERIDTYKSVYFEGSPCRRCGGTERYVCGGNCVPCARDQVRLRNYGVDREDYNVLFVSHSGCCAICGKASDKLHIDHNHLTGTVRALLCSCCNTGLGQFQEDPAILQAAIEYLQKHAANEARQDHGGASQTS